MTMAEPSLIIHYFLSQWYRWLRPSSLFINTNPDGELFVCSKVSICNEISQSQGNQLPFIGRRSGRLSPKRRRLRRQGFPEAVKPWQIQIAINLLCQKNIIKTKIRKFLESLVTFSRILRMLKSVRKSLKILLWLVSSLQTHLLPRLIFF